MSELENQDIYPENSSNGNHQQKKDDAKMDNVDYLSNVVNQYYRQDLEDLAQSRQSHDLDIVHKDNQAVADLEDPVTLLQKLIGIPPHITEYENKIEKLNQEIHDLEGKLANTAQLIAQMIPLLTRQPQLIRKKLEIFKALQQQIFFGKEANLNAIFQPEIDREKSQLNQLQSQINRIESKLIRPSKFADILIPLLVQKLRNKVQGLELTHAWQTANKEYPNELKQAITPVLKEIISQHIENHPQELVQAIAPQIATAIYKQIQLDREAMVKVIAPIIDRIIKQNTQQNQALMSHAIAPVLPPAIRQRINDAPQEIAHAIAPEIATAINEQIRIEQEAMVDALYPIMGSTVTKALAETLREINNKVENSLSPEGVSRKIRAKVKGVSEAELLLAETMAFTVRAVFLIQKDSGLVISSVQDSGEQKLESEMVAGMLTAMRSFVNEYIANTNNFSEVNEIDYGNSSIVLEVAGSCYLAVVIDGEPSKKYIRSMRHTFAWIIRDYGKYLETFDGNSVNVPDQVPSMLAALMVNQPQLPRRGFWGLMIVGLIFLGLITILLAPGQYRQIRNHRISDQITQALEAEPKLSNYDLGVKVNRKDKIIQLTGILPQEQLRQQAARISQSLAPDFTLKNGIIAVDLLLDPLQVTRKLTNIQAKLNQQQNIKIIAQYTDGKITIEGTAQKNSEIQKISQAFAQIPGVDINNQVKLQPRALNHRIYFNQGSIAIDPQDLNTKITDVVQFLKLNPEKKLKIVGYSTHLQEPGNNQKLATQRAKAVQKILTNQNIAENRIQVIARTSFPLGVDASDPAWLSRTVLFSLVKPSE